MVNQIVSYDIKNDKIFKKNLDDAIKSVGSLRFPLGKISRDIYKDSKKNFVLKGDGKYPSLSEPYKTRKEIRFGKKPILVASGQLRDSVTKPRDANSIRVISDKSLIQGTKVPYANFIQDGTSKMPARKYYFIDNAQSIRFTRIIADFVESKIEVMGNVK